MSLFDWLLLAHLVGDWLLQNDWMARTKQTRPVNPAIALHCTLYTLTLLVTLWLAHDNPTAPPPYLLFGALIFLSHWIIDAGKLAERWIVRYRQSQTLMMRIAVDQILHLLVIGVLVAWLIA